MKYLPVRARTVGAIGAAMAGMMAVDWRTHRELGAIAAHAVSAEQQARVRHAQMVSSAGGALGYLGLMAAFVMALLEARRRNLAKKERDRLFALSTDLFLIAGFDGRIVDLNPAWERTLGYGLDEIRARACLSLVHPDDRERTAAWRDALASGGSPGRHQNRMARADGSYRWLQWNAVADRGHRLIYAVATDVTVFKEEEKSEGEFLAMLTHELRTPLATISGALETLGRLDAAVSPGDARMLQAMAHRQSLQLGRLVSDFMEVQRLEYARLPFEAGRFDLGELAREAVGACAAAARRSQVTLALASHVPGLWVWADRMRIAQVLDNLLSNAVKASRPGGTVSVAAARKAAGLRLSVSDQGPGIAESIQPVVFEKFARKGWGSGKSSVGLGLHLAKIIVEKSGGRIGFETKAGQGTTFFFELPAPAS